MRVIIRRVFVCLFVLQSLSYQMYYSNATMQNLMLVAVLAGISADTQPWRLSLVFEMPKMRAVTAGR